MTRMTEEKAEKMLSFVSNIVDMEKNWNVLKVEDQY